NDVNNDGLLEPGEPVLSLVTVTLSGIGTTRTAPDGSYTFPGVPPGTYQLSETVPAGFVATSPNPVSVTVVVGGTSTVDFGNLPPTPTRTPIATSTPRPTRTPIPGAPTNTPTIAGS